MSTLNSVLLECQSCRTRINLGIDSSRLARAGEAGPASAPIDSSFLVVADPSRRRRAAGAAGGGAAGGAGGASARSLEDSFVLLGPEHSVMGGAGGGGWGATGTPQELLATQVRALASLFELASTDTLVDQPLCLDCARSLYNDLKNELQEVEREVAAYRDAIHELRQSQGGVGGVGGVGGRPSELSQPDLASPPHPPPADDPSSSPPAPPTPPSASPPAPPPPPPVRDQTAQLREELRQLRAEEAAERRRLQGLEKEYLGSLNELRTLEGESARLDLLEEGYWRELNRFQLDLQRHVEERDALLARVDRARQQLEGLRRTNVFNDVFRIWYDGPFGTISGFRLGRTPQVPVPWEEINSALGQCVLLMQGLANACRIEFSGVRLVPMASRSRIEERGRGHDLFGPVNRMNPLSGLDLGLVCYADCVKQLGEFARRRDLSEGKSRDDAFTLTYPIEGDKVGGLSVRYCLNKDTRWTKALKYLLADLKLCLNWVATARAEAVAQ